MSDPEKDPFKLPWSWNPWIRNVQKEEYYECQLRKIAPDPVSQQELEQSIDRQYHKYIIPRHAAAMLISTMLGLAKGEAGNLRQELLTDCSAQGFDLVVEDFELSTLKIESAPSLGTSYRSGENERYLGGHYSAEIIARTVGVNPNDLTDMLGDPSTDQNYLMLRDGSYIFEVRSSVIPNKIAISELMKLSEFGSAMLENSLASYARGLNFSD